MKVQHFSHCVCVALVGDLYTGPLTCGVVVNALSSIPFA